MADGAIAAIVLAAGRGSRFGPTHTASKVLVDLAGVPLVRIVAAAALAADLAPVLVVTGHADEDVTRALVGLSVQIVANPDYADGLSTSLRAGLAAVPPRVIGAVILLADMPRVRSQTIRMLAARFLKNPAGIDAVVPVVQGRSGNPVLVGRSLFAAINRLSGDAGARRLLEDPRSNVVFEDVEDPGIFIDVDTVEALTRLREGL